MAWTIDVSGYDEILAQLDRIDDTLTRRIKRDMVSAAARALAERVKARAPIGDRTDDTQGTPLREAIGYAVREYGETALAVVGPSFPEAAHAHNVEHGHAEVVFGRRTGRRVPPRPFLRPAVDETQEVQLQAMAAVLAAAVRDLGL